ncbi:ribosylglycohydrolase [Candidatus Poribacteria bacterium]|nr:MAG: ribosylglycohydrolase [Candidatus Poribacteria bacterium]
MNKNYIFRAQGCMMGQLAGDALGSLVEFKSLETIQRQYPDGVRDLKDGGTWNTIAGQPTDDSEMALLLARTLVEKQTYNKADLEKAYQYWLNSGPFDCGFTIRNSLGGTPMPESQANGALMRISPLGIFGVNYDPIQLAEWAREDAAITHIDHLCQDFNALFAMGIAHAIRSGCTPESLYQQILHWAHDMNTPGNALYTDPSDLEDESIKFEDERKRIIETIEKAKDSPPEDFISLSGWVLIAFQNALYQLLHAPTLEEGIIETVMEGGDTDTNAAICGALLGAVYGIDTVPERWVKKITNCRPQKGEDGVFRPRPECFWPVDALELAAQLVSK